MKKVILLIIVAAVTAFAVSFSLRYFDTSLSHDNLIRVTAPVPGAIVKSPLMVKGEAIGNWYFEASFPVELLAGNGKVIAQVPAQAKGDWMTMDFVPFEATLEFSSPTTDSGTLILKKDNPSGLPEYDDSLAISVRFR